VLIPESGGGTIGIRRTSRLGHIYTRLWTYVKVREGAKRGADFKKKSSTEKVREEKRETQKYQNI